MEYVIQTPEDRAAITELPITAIKTHRLLQNRNVGSQKYRDDNDNKRYAGHIKDIAEDIRRQGQLVPIKVVVASDDDSATTEHFWLVDGHHRLEAIGKLKQKTIRVEVVGDRGFISAQAQSCLSNKEIVQPLSLTERTENVWKALNLPTDYFRAMKIEELAKNLCISPSTIKRMRRSVREEAEAKGAINQELTKPEQHTQFMTYWNQESTYSRLYFYPWYIHSKGKEEELEGKAPNRVRELKKVLVQAALGDAGRFDAKTIQQALQELAEESIKGTKHLEKRYKPTITQRAFYQHIDNSDWLNPTLEPELDTNEDF